MTNLTDEELAAIRERFNRLDRLNDAENPDDDPKTFSNALHIRAWACAWDVQPLLAEVERLRRRKGHPADIAEIARLEGERDSYKAWNDTARRQLAVSQAETAGLRGELANIRITLGEQIEAAAAILDSRAADGLAKLQLCPDEADGLRDAAAAYRRVAALVRGGSDSGSHQTEAPAGDDAHYEQADDELADIEQRVAVNRALKEAAKAWAETERHRSPATMDSSIWLEEQHTRASALIAAVDALSAATGEEVGDRG